MDSYFSVQLEALELKMLHIPGVTLCLSIISSLQLEPRPWRPLTPHPQTPLRLHLSLSLSSLPVPFSYCFFFFNFISQPLYLSPLSRLCSYQDLFPIFPDPLFFPLAPLFSLISLSAAASRRRSHFSSTWGSFPSRSAGMYSFICMAPAFYWIPIALEQSYHTPKFIKGQFNSKFMKWASVKVPAPMRFVRSHGASHIHWGTSVTQVQFPSVIRNYWVAPFALILDSIKRQPPLFPPNGTSPTHKSEYLPRSYRMYSVRSQVLESWHEAVVFHPVFIVQSV